jgi:uncharacterized membrane protein
LNSRITSFYHELKELKPEKQMKILKKVIGVLAALFALMHFLGLLNAFAQNKISFSTAYNMGVFFGQMAGLVIGSLVAYFCFRAKRVNY